MAKKSPYQGGSLLWSFAEKQNAKQLNCIEMDFSIPGWLTTCVYRHREWMDFSQFKELNPMLGLLLLVILFVLLIGALPSWPYSAAWGYYPSGGLGAVLVIVLILVLLGRA